MDVFFLRKRFFSILKISIITFLFGACFSGCALVEKWKKQSETPDRPSPPIFLNNPDKNTPGPKVDIEPISHSSTQKPEQGLDPQRIAAQAESAYQKQIAELQQQTQLQSEQLNAEIARLQKELDAKEQKVQSLNASFRQQATIIVPEKNPLKYTPVFSAEGIFVLPRNGDTLRIAVEDSAIFYPHAMQLLPTADALLNTVVKEIRANYPDQQIGIEAHADPTLVNPQNPMQIFETTTRKANIVAKRLVEQNRLNSKNLIVVGHGASKPLPRSGTVVNNNRVEFVVYP